MDSNKKLLIVAGATASGKTGLGINFAKKFNGEIVSSDSRHVYQGMDIGTGKDIPVNSRGLVSSALDGKFKKINNAFSAVYRLKDGIPVWMLDIVLPSYQFNLADYIKLATYVINDIWSRDKLPVIVGGTGLYIKALISPLELINIPPDPELRIELDNLSITKLQLILKKINPGKWAKLNKSDMENPRRLIRGIEISKSTVNIKYSELKSDWLMILTSPGLPSLYKGIDHRVEKRIKEGMVEEIMELQNLGYNFDLPSFSACGYRLFKPYFDGSKSEESLKEVIKKWKFTEHALARRQITWFKKMLKDPGLKRNIFEINNPDLNRFKLETRINEWYTSK